ncbi:hypothetical protein GYMLUDRAFT_94806 [Collybiopsis luxurians FD-317 M1]|nr:hypothetical protein GYMLUDRAFT_94806 [Collybiopsis luxurians FD-317 M1]
MRGSARLLFTVRLYLRPEPGEDEEKEVVVASRSEVELYVEVLAESGGEMVASVEVFMWVYDAEEVTESAMGNSTIGPT